MLIVIGRKILEQECVLCKLFFSNYQDNYIYDDTLLQTMVATARKFFSNIKFPRVLLPEWILIVSLYQCHLRRTWFSSAQMATGIISLHLIINHNANCKLR